MDIFSVVQIIFIVLKCLKLITWSWWAVFSPLWIEIALYIGVYFCAWLED